MIPNAAKSGFSLEDLQRMGPDEIAQKRKLAEALLAQSQGIRRIENPLEGMAQMAQALIGNLKGAYLDRKEREGRMGANSLFSAGMGMGEYPPAPTGGAPASASGAPVNPNVADGSKGNESYPAAPASQQAAGGDIEAYIRQAAAARGIDPDVAVRVAKSEGGLSDPYRQADGMLKYGREESYGPFQLHMRMGGVGTRALAEGIDPRKDWKGGIDYALNEAAKKGWGQWFGAAKAGIGNRTGLDRAQAIAVQRAQEQAAQAAAPTQVASLDPSAGLPPSANAMLPPTAGAAPGQEAIAKALLGTPADALATDLIAKQAANPGAPVISTDTAAFQPPVLPTPAAPGVVPPGTPPAAQVPIPAPAAGAPVAPVGQGTPPPAQAQLAQALIGGQPDIGLSMGATPHAPGAGPDMNTLMNMAGNEFMSPQQQKLIEALTGQKMEQAAKQSDPGYQLDLETKRAQLDALKRPGKEWQRLDDNTLFNPATGETKDTVGGDVKPPHVETLYDPQTGQEYKAQWNPQTAQWDKVGGNKADKGGLSVTTNPDGTVSVTQGAGRTLTEGQSKDTVFATKAEGALPTIDKLGDALTSLPENLASQAPFIGNYMKSPEYQQADQAGREFLAAILRKESGAAISIPERQEYGEIYLPQPGDKKPVLAQKKAARQRALDAIKAGMPPAAILAQENALKAGAERSGADAAGATPEPSSDTPPASYTGKFWKYLTPEQRKLWQ